MANEVAELKLKTLRCETFIVNKFCEVYSFCEVHFIFLML